MGNNTPLVSVVIPAYNHAGYLEEAIRSVLSQDYPNIELLVLDDGSTDDTCGVLERYENRFYWETQENMGQAETLNKGWRMSKGEVLAYLSPDDLLAPKAVSASMERLLSIPGAVMTYCDYYLIDESSALVRRVQAPEFDYREVVAKFICPPGPGAFFLRGAFEAAGPWNAEFRQIPDYDFWLRLALHGKVVKIPQALASFRVHGGSQTFAEADEKKSEEYVKVISDYYRFRHDIPAEVLAAKNEALSNAYIFAARSHFRSKRYAKGLRRLQKGLRLYPKNVSGRTARIIAHGLLNHVRHGLSQRAKRRARR